MEVERSLGDTHSLGDVVEGHAKAAVLGEDAERRVEDLPLAEGSGAVDEPVLFHGTLNSFSGRSEDYLTIQSEAVYDAAGPSAKLLAYPYAYRSFRIS